MKIVSIEPTPSPNTMKINLDEALTGGARNNYTNANSDQAPPVIKQILDIDGVKGVYHVSDFLAVERNAKYDWQKILEQVRIVFGESITLEESNPSINEGFGEVKVFVQMYRGIPMQVKLVESTTEKRVAIPEKFTNALLQAQKHSDNVVLERSWKEYGIRYGDLQQIAEEVIEELSAAYREERLTQLVTLSSENQTSKTLPKRESYKVTMEMLENSDWSKRYEVLEQMDPTEADIPVLAKALEDEKASIRRLAVVYLGMIESKEVLPLLYHALKDKSVAVRRTAGDCLSDIGDKDAIGPMVDALRDSSKLVRWRAAMFLYEEGDESALPALKEAEEDPEFEVKMQIKLAIARIENGEKALGSVWKQMTESRKSN